MNSNDLHLDDGKYISVREAADKTKYTIDYIGQLCRAGKIKAHRVGYNWFVGEDSILVHYSKKSYLSKNHKFRNGASNGGKELQRKELNSPDLSQVAQTGGEQKIITRGEKQILSPFVGEARNESGDVFVPRSLSRETFTTLNSYVSQIKNENQKIKEKK